MNRDQLRKRLELLELSYPDKLTMLAVLVEDLFEEQVVEINITDKSGQTIAHLMPIKTFSDFERAKLFADFRYPDGVPLAEEVQKHLTS